MSVSTVQELPNRVNTGASTAVRGSGTGVDSSDGLVLAHDGSHYMWLPGSSNNYLSVPDEAALDITGDLELVARVGAVDWVTNQNIFNKSTIAYALRVLATNRLRLYINSNTYDSTVTLGFTAGEPYWLKVTRRQSDGRIQFFTAPDSATEPASWTQLGADVTGTTAAIATNANQLGVGASTSGGTALNGGLYRAIVRDGIDGTEVLDINPAADIDTSSDPDDGQTSFTCTTGQTVTVNRGTSDYATMTVTRAVSGLDGVDDYIQQPASDKPAFTATTGDYSVAVLYRLHNTPGGDERLWSSESAEDNGAYLAVDTSQDVKAVVGGVTTTATETVAGSFADSSLRVAILVQESGTLKAFANGASISAGASTSGVGTITHADPRVGSRADSTADLVNGEVFAVLVFEDYALDGAQSETLSTQLIAGLHS